MSLMNPVQIASEREVETVATPPSEAVAEQLESASRIARGMPRAPEPPSRRSVLAGRWRWILAFVAGAFFTFTATAASYAVYQYSESADFCATTCHPMSPQATVYRQQAHANIACSTCHVGEGFTYFLKSKINGTRQLIETLTDSYERPVPSPVKDLRPARETCETCHRPEKFTDSVVKLHTHFQEDEQNSETDTLLVLRLGGYDNTTGQSKGIHWHIKSKVYYIAADEQRQVMQWVGVDNGDGKLTEYWSPDVTAARDSHFVARARAEGRLRLLDCIDCHNRAAHLIEPPATLVDEALAAGLLDRNLPYIKRKSVELLSGKYSTQQAGLEAIAGLADYYRAEYPAVFAGNQEGIRKAVSYLQDIFSKTNFPDMNLDWQTYPNNVNHREFKGCARCHEDRLRRFDEQGRVAGKISGDCKLCHSVPIVTRPGGPEARVEPTLKPTGLEYLVRDSSGALLASPSDGGPIDLARPGEIRASVVSATSPPGESSKPLLVGPPLLAEPLPASHRDPDYSLDHRDISEAERATCGRCHGGEPGDSGGSFCENCHRNSPPHPRDILFTHPRVIQEQRETGGLACSTCHQQNLSCSRCHAEDVVGTRTQPMGLPAVRGRGES